jgi:hypothetical protein
VFEQPDVNSKKVGELNRGDEFEITSAGTVRGPQYRFYRVRTSRGLEGFVFDGNLMAPA